MKTLKELIKTVVLTLIVALAVLLVYLGWTDRLSNEILLPLLAIVGVVCLLMALTLAAILFARLGMADRTQALALPEGSVRAVIALALIVLFAIITVFLYGSLANGELRRISVPNYAAAKAMSDSASRPDSGIEIVFINPSIEPPSVSNPDGTTSDNSSTTDITTDISSTTDTTTDIATTTSITSDTTSPDKKKKKDKNTQPQHPEGTFQIGYRSRVSHDAADFAKQLMTLLGTLVTSMAAFYFGARTVASTLDSAAALHPSIASVTPSEVPSTGGNPQGTAQVAIAGSGLNGTKSVKLSSTDKPSIEGTIVQKSDCAVVCTFAGLKPGTWDLVVTGDGEPLRRPFTVTT